MRTIVDLPEEQIRALAIIGERQKLSRAELLRRAVHDFLKTHQDVDARAAFGMWGARGEDGLSVQNRLRAEWNR